MTKSGVFFDDFYRPAFSKLLRPMLRYLQFGLSVLLLAGLTACSGSNNLASSFTGLLNQNDGTAGDQNTATVAFAPLVGVPSHLSGKMMSAVQTAASQKNWRLVDDVSKAHYAINGHFTAYTTTSGAKLSYIWDVKDKRGVHLHRVIGSQPIAGGKVANGWSLVNDQVISSIAETSTAKLNTWLLNAPANKQPPASGRDLDGPTNISPVAKRTQGLPEDPVITGTVGKRTGPLLTMVKPVRGAPGDGRISLTNALRTELKKNGVALTDQRVANGYTVEGLVKLQKAPQNKQNIEIVWNVLDGKGHRVGTVSQKNVVPNGSLNGAWGPTAVAAASAAAKGIVKLLPSKR